MFDKHYLETIQSGLIYLVLGCYLLDFPNQNYHLVCSFFFFLFHPCLKMKKMGNVQLIF